MHHRLIRSIATLMIVLVAFTSVSVAATPPTEKNARYSDKFDRSVLDFWKAKSSKPTPVVVYFHGGGFKQGDKSHFYRSRLIDDFLPKGVSFVTVNYPFLEHTNNDYFAILKHTEEAIKFLHSKAKEWNIDPSRIAVSGSSAGALISGHLGYGTNLKVSAVFAIQQPIGTDVLMLTKIRKGGPPSILYTTSNTQDRVHHPRYAQMVHDQCKKCGIYSEVWGREGSGLPSLKKGTRIEEQAMQMFFKTWKLKYPG